MAGVGLKVSIDGDASGLAKSLDEATKATTGFSIPAVAGLTAVAGGALLAAGKIAEFTQAAAEDRAEQQKLETVYKNTGAAVGDYTAQIDAAIAAGADKAFSDSEVRAGLQSLVTVTKNAEDANALLANAMDIARFAGVSLETASDAVAKAAGGQDKALRALIPGLEKGATATDTIRNATDLAKGSADDYAASAEGMGKKGSDAFGELTESIGSAFLPILDELLPALIPIITALGDIIKLLVPILVPAIKVMVSAIKIAIDVFMSLLDIIKQVIKFVSDLIGAIANIKFPDIKLPSLPFSFAAPPSSATAAAFGVAPQSAVPAVSGNVIFNINGDPSTIERTVIGALRSYSRRTGSPIAGIS